MLTLNKAAAEATRSAPLSRASDSTAMLPLIRPTTSFRMSRNRLEKKDRVAARMPMFILSLVDGPL